MASIIIPCRNEREFIGGCLDSIIASTYPKDRLEVLVVDGMSEDGTRAILADYSSRHSWIRVLDNPNKTTPFAMNIGIQTSRGDFVMMMSAHAEYEPSAIGRSVRLATESGADNVGGMWQVEPRRNTFWDRCAVVALSSRFGVGPAHYRVSPSGSPRWVDTAAFGCYRKDVFARIGLMNEKLTHSQDMEFNRRLLKSGGRTLLAPDVQVKYYARTDFKSFLRHNLRNGIWAIKPFLYSRIMPVAWRHLVPLLFVVTLLASLVLAATPQLELGTFALISGLYLAASLVSSANISWKQKDPRFAVVLPVYFFTLHICYGLGSLWGCLLVLRSKLTTFFGRSLLDPVSGEVQQDDWVIDYSKVSETPGDRITREAMEMLRARYTVAAGLSEGKDVLEVACGSGHGLGLLAASARRLVGGDYSGPLLASARQHYGGRIPLVRFSAEAMPFREACFDMIVCLEAIYYIPGAEHFVSECRRVLRPDGAVLLCSANKEWRGFFPGALSSKYFSARELSLLFNDNGFLVETLGAFPDVSRTFFQRLVSLIRSWAAALRLIPGTMRAKERLKRLFYGPLLTVPPEITRDGLTKPALAPLQPNSPASPYKVIYTIGRLGRKSSLLLGEWAEQTSFSPPSCSGTRYPSSGPSGQSPWFYPGIKRLFDAVFGAIGFLLLTPLLALIAAWIKMGSPGPVFYRGVRVGRNGRLFRIFKFRTMVNDAEKRGGPTTPDDDPRITPAGHLMRKYKLDELPQLINILKGEMSFVGPRPEVPQEVERYTEEEKEILKVRPGITDYSSIKFHNEGEILRGSDDPHRAYIEKIRPEKMRLRLEYVRHASFWIDINIIFSTLKTLLSTRVKSQLAGARRDAAGE
jgi:lipopolysaccharide/colanic/teichoic acid biosynthesis glycosyltransferase/glycosyltransferase involved in cell wall biosynthesis/ubiquinone/menaquinone biosynthesis C-methylase UbiE